MDAKIVHNYSPEAPHIYLGPQVCYKTSLDQDTWQWTGSALENAPPATGENEIAAANADFTDWDVIADFVGFKYWLADGSDHEITEYGVSPPADALTEKPVVPKTDEELIEEFKTEIQKRLDDFAKTRGYDGCLSCCTYADSEIAKFAAEGQYMRLARDQHWNIGYQIITDVQAGDREVPTLEQLFIELGPLEWAN